MQVSFQVLELHIFFAFVIWHHRDSVVYLVAIAVGAVIHKEDSFWIFILDDSEVFNIYVRTYLVAILSRQDKSDEFSLWVKILDDLQRVLVDRCSEYSNVEGLGQVLDDVLCMRTDIDLRLLSQ